MQIPFNRLRTTIAALLAGLLLVASRGISGAAPAAPEPVAGPSEGDLADLEALGKRVKGFVVWESNRTGNWELYRINTDGSGFKQLTQLAGPKAGLRYSSYLRPRISPDGSTVLFAYGKPGGLSGVWVVPAEGGEARQLTPDGIPLRWADGGREIAFLRDGQLWHYRVTDGFQSRLSSQRLSSEQYMRGDLVGDVRPDLNNAVFHTIHPAVNQLFDLRRRRIIKSTHGCQPQLSPDGRYFYWVNAPYDFQIFDLKTGEQSQLLGLPGTSHWYYTYFPTLSYDDHWLAYAASPGQQNHSTSDYEIYVQELDKLKPVGKPVRLSWDPHTDRWPMLWTDTPDGRGAGNHVWTIELPPPPRGRDGHGRKPQPVTLDPELTPRAIRETAADGRTVRLAERGYDRARSRVMLREIVHPTRARLDFAAYDRNILLHVPHPAPLAAPTPPARLVDLTFSNTLEPGTQRHTLAETPLTPDEKRQPLAMTPLMDYLALWNFDRAEPLMVGAARVANEKWGNTGSALPLQRMNTGYLHHTAEGLRLWVKIEFEPNVNFIQGLTDGDGDGYSEMYAQIDPAAAAQPVLEHIGQDYLSRILTVAEVRGYFYELTSSWYQSLGTVLLKPEETRPWPNRQTEPDIRHEMGDYTLRRPTAVLRGHPFDVPLYNVFVVRGAAPSHAAKSRLTVAAAPVVPTAPTPINMRANVERWRQELQDWGSGDWTKWDQTLKPFQEDVRRQLQERPATIQALMGLDGFLFYRGSLEYLVGGDPQQQAGDKNPLPAIVDYKQQLSKLGVDLLMVVIPSKPEIYPEKLSAAAPSGNHPYVTPYTRKLLVDLAAAGVEAVDLMPAFVAARDKGRDPFYMPLDTHWSSDAIQLSARLIGDRVKAYPWFAAVRRRPVKYALRPTSFLRGGDIRGMLPEEEKLKYRPMKLAARQVFGPLGVAYEDDATSPVVVLGDSFCGVYHYEDCGHAGLSDHLAYQLGMPVDLISAQGSGPTIRLQLARRGLKALKRKKLVVWTVVARDLYNYYAGWKKMPAVAPTGE